MKSLITVTLISMVSLAAVPSARATECLLPSAPSKIPDGKTATAPEMRTAMETVTQYKGDVDTYLKCLEFERKQGHMSAGQESALHNTAIDTLETVANKFNAQVRTFKARSG
jgi:hypothetical protein